MALFSRLQGWKIVARYDPLRVAGVTFDNDNGSSRQHILRKCVVGMRIRLRHDRNNPADANAVAVLVPGGQQIGFLERDVAAWVAPLLDSGTVDLECTLTMLSPFIADDGREVVAAEISVARREIATLEPLLVRIPQEFVRLIANLVVLIVTAIAFVLTRCFRLLRMMARPATPFVRDAARSAVRGSREALRAVDGRLERLAGGDRFLLVVYRVLAAFLVICVVALALFV